MTTLALLRDYAGCRAVLHDARQGRPDLAPRLEAVVAEAEEAIWGGGEVERIDCWVTRRVPPERPNVSAEAFDDYRFDGYDDPDDSGPSYEEAHRAWAEDRRREHRARVRAYLATDWLAWDDRGARSRGHAWAGEAPGFFGVDRSHRPVFGGVEPVPAYRADPDAFRISADVLPPGLQPNTMYVGRTVHERLTGLLVGRRSGKTAAARMRRLGIPMREGTIGERARASQAVHGFRPRWAPALAATLAEVAFRPLVPHETTRPSDDGIEIRVRSYANLIADAPAAYIPGLEDP